MMANRQGGCLCGAVRFELLAEPVMMVLCHCANCQKASGGPFTSNLVVPEAAYVQTGETRTYLDHGDSGGAVQRLFCPNCGSPVVSKPEALPGLVVVKAGAMDEALDLTPSMEMYTARAAAWVAPIEGANRFATMPGPPA